MARAQSEWEDDEDKGQSKWGTSEWDIDGGDDLKTRVVSEWDHDLKAPQPSVWEDEADVEHKPSVWEEDTHRDNAVQDEPTENPSNLRDGSGGGGRNAADLSPSSQSALHSQFMAACTSGEPELDKVAFKKLVKTLLAAVQEAEGDEDNSDDDDNNDRTARKKRASRSTTNTTPTEKDLDAAFVVADADKNGKVDYAEFVALYELVKSGEVVGLGKPVRSFFGRSSTATKRKTSSFQQSFREQKELTVEAAAAEKEASRKAAELQAQKSKKAPPKRKLSKKQQEVVVAVVRDYFSNSSSSSQKGERHQKTRVFRVNDHVEASDDKGQWHPAVVTAVATVNGTVEYSVDFLDVGGGMDELAADGVRPLPIELLDSTTHGLNRAHEGNDNSGDSSSSDNETKSGKRVTRKEREAVAAAADPLSRVLHVKVKPGQSPKYLAAALQAKYDLPPSRAWAIAHNLKIAMRRRSRTSADPFDSRIVIATQAPTTTEGEVANRHLDGDGSNAGDGTTGIEPGGKKARKAQRRRRGADLSIGFSGYDTLSSDEEAGELPWRADVDGFGVSYATTAAAAAAGAEPGAEPGAGARAGGGTGRTPPTTEGQLGSVFGHGGGYGALGGGGEAAAAEKAVRMERDRERDLKLRLHAARSRLESAYNARRALQKRRRAAKQALGLEVDQDEEEEEAQAAALAAAKAKAEAEKRAAAEEAGSSSISMVDPASLLTPPELPLPSVEVDFDNLGLDDLSGALTSVSLSGGGGQGGDNENEEEEAMSLRHERKRTQDLRRLGPPGARAAAKPPPPNFLEAAAAQAFSAGEGATAALEASLEARRLAAAEAAACDPKALSHPSHPEARSLPSPQQLAGWLGGCCEAPRPRYERPASAVARTPFLQGLADTMDRRRKFDPRNLADSITDMRRAHESAKEHLENHEKGPTALKMPMQ